MRVAAFAVSASFVSLALAAVCSSAGAQESQIATLRAATTAAPGDASAGLSLGRALRRAGHLKEAGAELRRARAIAGPSVALAVDWERERLEYDRRDYFQAIVVCKDIASLPGKVGAGAPEHGCLAAAELVRQRATEALNETALALAKDPRCFEAKLAEGRAYSLQLDGTRAEASLRAAMGLQPTSVEPFLELGRVLERQGKHDDAVADLRSAVQLDPHAPDALFALASAMGPWGGAERLDLLKRATDERPSFLEAWLALGAGLLDANRVGDAKAAASAALQVDATSAPARILLGKIALIEGHPDEAIDDGRAALKVMANSAAATLLVADGQAKKGELDLALEAYQAAWGLDHGDPTPLVHASEACHTGGRDTSARAFGIKATQEFPKWGPGWAALGDALVGQNERLAARDAYRRALAGDGLPSASGVQAKLAALQ
ncbi:MAG: tetratricopeptide repeat protein [Polyangiaceae bacterium]